MDFEALQADARSDGRRLTVIFALAVAAVAGVTAAAVTPTVMALGWMLGVMMVAAETSEPSGASPVALSLWVFAVTVVVVSGFITVLTWQRRRAIESGGGRRIARSLGGRLADPAGATGAERRFCNAVAEIAVAAGRPTPEVWVLEREHSLNVFNAGWTDDKTVIGITSGALIGLERDELQAVAAQAMSHVLHGDARLNLRLMAMVTGIAGLVIMGEDLVERATNDGKGSAFDDDEDGIIAVPLLVLGTVLKALGWVGVFLATTIQQSIASRHELLADATAVELTRDPESMRDALRRIGGHPDRGRIGHHGRRTLNHLFLVDSRGRGKGTIHPPLALRIKLLDDSWQGGMMEPAVFSDGRPSAAGLSAEPDAPAGVADPFGLVHFDALAPAAPAIDALMSGVAAVTATAPSGITEAFHDAVSLPTVAAIAAEQRDGGRFASEIAAASRSPLGCRAIMVTLAGLAGGVTELEMLLTLAEAQGPTEPGLDEQLGELAPSVQRVACGDRAALVALTAPQAVEGDDPIIDAYRRIVIDLLDRSDSTALDSWILAHQMRHRVERRGPAKRSRTLERLRGPYAEILTFVAVVGRSDLATTVSVGGYAAGLGTLHPRDPNQVDLRSVDRALAKLSRVDDEGRVRLLAGLLAAVAGDNRVTTIESDMVQAIAVALGAPVPVLTT